MVKLSWPAKLGDSGHIMFWCPGCDCAHAVNIGTPTSWGYNGDPESPTFTPSIFVKSGHYARGQPPGKCWCDYELEEGETRSEFQCLHCHSFVTDGQIQFLTDCVHGLAGHTVPLPDWPGRP